MAASEAELSSKSDPRMERPSNEGELPITVGVQAEVGLLRRDSSIRQRSRRDC